MAEKHKRNKSACRLLSSSRAKCTLRVRMELKLSATMKANQNELKYESNRRQPSTADNVTKM